MIRINLLPFRSARRKENIRKQISICLLSVILFVAVMGYFFLNLNNKLGILESDRAEKTKKLITYTATNKKIIKLKKTIKEIRTKVEAIEELERNKIGPVRLLDEISMAVPKNKLWLRSLDEKEGILTLMGSAPRKAREKPVKET
jgi:type IV pilus assembly protein PilN